MKERVKEIFTKLKFAASKITPAMIVGVIAIIVALTLIVVALSIYKETVSALLMIGFVIFVLLYDPNTLLQKRLAKQNRNNIYAWQLWEFWQYITSNCEPPLPFLPILDANEFGSKITSDIHNNYLILRLDVEKNEFTPKWKVLLLPLIRKHLLHYLYITQNPQFRIVCWEWLDKGEIVSFTFLFFDNEISRNIYISNHAIQPTEFLQAVNSTAIIDEDF